MATEMTRLGHLVASFLSETLVCAPQTAQKEKGAATHIAWEKASPLKYPHLPLRSFLDEEKHNLRGLAALPDFPYGFRRYAPEQGPTTFRHPFDNIVGNS